MDNEVIRARRDGALRLIDGYYQAITAQKKSIEQLKEDVAREVWTCLQLMERVPPELSEQIMIEREVNTMDPDFSFLTAIGME